jgi:hypothetical protein
MFLEISVNFIAKKVATFTPELLATFARNNHQYDK